MLLVLQTTMMSIQIDGLMKQVNRFMDTMVTAMFIQIANQY